MPDDSFAGQPCWSASAARAIFRTEALEGEDAIFLATHTPIRDFSIRGSHGSDIRQATEQSFSRHCQILSGAMHSAPCWANLGQVSRI